MTTPNQLPIDRAFVIGGETADGTTDVSYPGNNYGQNFTDSGIRSLFEIPALTLTNVVEVFTNLLLRLPLEALKLFAPIIPGGIENFTDVLSGVNAIVGSLTEVVATVPMAVFQAFMDILSGNPGAAVEDVAELIKSGLEGLETLIHLFLGLFGIDIEGSMLDQIFDLIDEFDEWLSAFDFLQGGFDNLFGFVKDLVDGIISIIRKVPFVGPTLADSLDALLPDMDGWRTDTESTRTNITNGITGAGLENPGQTELTTAVEGQADAVAGTAAAVAQVQAAMSPGNPDSDDYERSSSGSWGANWLVMEDGEGGDASIDGHNAVWVADYTKDSEMVARRTSKTATSDNQTVSCILGSSPGTMTDGTSAHDLWLRCTTFSTYATRTGLRMRFWADKRLELAWFNAGTKTVLATGTANTSMSNGSTLTFEAGQGLSPRRFVAKINNSPVMDFTEAGTTSQVGASYRSRGVGLRGEFSLIGIGFVPALMMQPGKLKQWTATG